MQCFRQQIHLSFCLYRSLSCISFKVKYSTQGHSSHSSHRKGDSGCHSSDQKPIDDCNSSSLCHLKEGPSLANQAVFRGEATFSGIDKCLFSPPASCLPRVPNTHKYLAMSGNKGERNIVTITDEENKYDRLVQVRS